MVITFNLAYLETPDRGGHWVYNRRFIALHYFRGWFTVDFLSILPFFLITLKYDDPFNNNQSVGASSGASALRATVLFRIVKLLRMVKLARLFKASRVIQRQFLGDAFCLPLPTRLHRGMLCTRFHDLLLSRFSLRVHTPPHFASHGMNEDCQLTVPHGCLSIADILMNRWEWTYAVIKMIKLFAFLTTYAHFQACLCAYNSHGLSGSRPSRPFSPCARDDGQKQSVSICMAVAPSRPPIHTFPPQLHRRLHLFLDERGGVEDPQLAQRV